MFDFLCYNGWFFRSLTELSYMINVIEKDGLEWKTAENQEFKVKYINKDGNKSNYFADFIIENKKMVEVKPKNLQTTESVILKAKAARKFCKKKQLEYEMIDPTPLTDDEIMHLHNEEKITFTETTEKSLLKNI
jgi:hypothetical protein